ncbi:MAG: kelch repeat-containing protein [Pseudomonadota bacterium]
MMRATTVLLGVLALAAMACEPTIEVKLTVVPPCDQGDALDGTGTIRFEITGTEVKPLASNFSRGKKTGAITGLPLGDDIVVGVKAYAGDVEKTPDVLNTSPLAAGSTQPRDYTAESERSIEISVPVGKVDTFASTTNAAEKKCTAMSTPRHGHTATYLPKLGKVLIVGGASVDENGQDRILATAELYDPAKGTFEALPEPPGGPRVYHAAVALADGRALITGGIGMINNNLQTLGSGFVYDPGVSGNRSPYTLVVMPTHQARAHHTATLSETGNVVLLVGGCTNSAGQVCTRSSASNAFETTLVFDIAQFDGGNTALTPGPNLPGDEGRVFHVALPLPDGRILIAGGSTGGAQPACKLLMYDSRQMTFLADFTDTLSGDGCTSHLAGAVFTDGRVVLSGGYKSLNLDGSPPASATEISAATTVWDSAQTVRVSTGPALSAGRAEHVAFALLTDELLVVGGQGGSSDAERVDLVAQQSVPTAGVPVSKRLAIAGVSLGSGQPLLLGGIDPTDGASGATQAAAELFFYAR